MEILHAYFEAINRHDAEAAAGFLVASFQARFPGGIVMDRDQVRNLLAWDFAVNGRYRLEGVEQRGETVTATLVERNDFFELIGIQELHGRLNCRFTSDGILVEMGYEPLPGQPSYTDALQPALTWAAAHRPDALAEVYSEGNMVITTEAAPRWLALLREWRAATAGETEER